MYSRSGRATSAERNRRLRERLRQREILVLPGTHDALTARVAEQVGFEAIYVSGSATASATLGMPDVGLATMTEMVGHAARIAAAVSIPVVADADTGYGNAVNVVRTVEEFERAGVSCIHLEDLVIPTRFGQVDGREVAELEEMLGKLRAALDARSDPNFSIMARTDARYVLGLEETMRRVRAFQDVGVDAVFPEGLQTAGEFEAVARGVQVPLLADMAEWGRSPLLSAEELQQMGYSIALFPTTSMRAAHLAIAGVLSELKEKGTQREMLDRLQPRAKLLDLLAMDDYSAAEKRYMSR